MLKNFLIFSCLFLFGLFMVMPVQASADSSFVSIVNPVRGNDFWDIPGQKPVDAVSGQLQILRSQNVKATFLIRFDALQDPSIVNSLKNSPDEKGLFLEITPSLTSAAQIKYHNSTSWHNAASVLLTGYSLSDRLKLIDTSFEKFKKTFGNYPKSVGAWWIGADGLSYMQQKYGISNAMIVADQYSTDSYQIWGQYWGTPYYPAKNNSLFPAQSIDNKIPIVITQWAARDPVNGYGTGVEESTYSVQANDYLDYHNLKTDYFSKLIDIYTKSNDNQFGQIVVGLENSYSWDKYKSEYKNQITDLVKKQKSGQFNIVSLNDFATWYIQKFPTTSPNQMIAAKDPLGSEKMAVWYMNNFYRVGWIYNNEGSVIRDLRQYVPGQSEICLITVCNEVNFATFATRVLDEVTYGQKRVIDEGKIANLVTSRQSDRVVLNYTNQFGKSENVQFLPRDISINNQPSSIDGFILDTIQKSQTTQKKSLFNNDLSLTSSIITQLGEFIIFWLAILFAILIPGEVIIKKNLPDLNGSTKLFLSLVIGLVEITLLGFVSQVLIKSYWFIPIWVVINIGLFIYYKLYTSYSKSKINGSKIILAGLIILGTIFMATPTFRNGLEYGYGVGFWGPNGHDGVWHLALINQLEKSAPPANPILAGTQLQNYHYFFDLLAALTSTWTKIPSVDLLFREFPILFGLLLGTGTLSLLSFLTNKRGFLTSSLSLYLIYTAGSFGWIIELIKHQGLNGESDFWANQAVSFNLNPPFMISLLIVIAFVEILILYYKHPRKALIIPLILLSGSLFEFKAYGAILVGIALLALTIFSSFKKDFKFVPILFGMAILTIVLLIPNYPSLSSILQTGSGVFEFSPLWFIHSMIDSPDRLGWVRLSLTRISGYETKNIFKIIYAEGLGIILFILGNLGIRLMGFGLLFKKKIWPDFGYLFIFVLSLFSIVIPLLFIQKGTPWNTIQFLYYFLFFSSILAAITFSNLIQKLPKIAQLILIILILIITPINCLVVAQGYLYPKPHTFVSVDELTALNFIKNQPNGVILTYPYNKYQKNSLEDPLPLLAYETTAYVSAFSGKTTFEEDDIQQDILNFNPEAEYAKRITAEKNFFAGMESTQAIAFLDTNKIKYIYLPKIYAVHLDEQSIGLKSIFENDQVIIYEVSN